MNAKYLFRLRPGRPTLVLHVPLKCGTRRIEEKPDGEWYETSHYDDARRLASEESVELMSPTVDAPAPVEVEEVVADESKTVKTADKSKRDRGAN